MNVLDFEESLVELECANAALRIIQTAFAECGMCIDMNDTQKALFLIWDIQNKNLKNLRGLMNKEYMQKLTGESGEESEPKE